MRCLTWPLLSWLLNTRVDLHSNKNTRETSYGQILWLRFRNSSGHSGSEQFWIPIGNPTDVGQTDLIRIEMFDFGPEMGSTWLDFALA